MSFDDDRLNWSLRHGAVGDYADEVFSELACACQEICDEHFPRRDGFDVRPTRISGPIEGINLTVERGAFRAQISVQRYLRLRGLGGTRDGAHEIRVVAAARNQVAPLCRTAPSRSLATRLAGVFIVTALLAIVALGVAGVLTTWSQAVLMLPVLLGLRMYWASRIAAKLREPTKLALPESRALERPTRRRWQAALSELEAQREALAERFARRPFRCIPTAPALGPAGARALRSAG